MSTSAAEGFYFWASSHEGYSSRLPDITTMPHGNLHRRDFHPQAWQLASLRSP